MSQAFSKIDFTGVAASWGVDLPAAFAALATLYDEVDARNADNTRGLDLPCHRGCDMCCHESVFLTLLEFCYVWNYVQIHFTDDARNHVINEGLRLYEENRPLIDALDRPPPPGEPDHFSIAKKIRFTCPLLGADGACRVYPVRELLARLFGCSFNDTSGVYGCHLVAAHLADKTVRLLPARGTARRLRDLPLTDKRQVYPYYFNLLFAQEAREAPAALAPPPIAGAKRP